MKRLFTALARVCGVALAATALVPAAHAAYPDKPVRLVVGFAPGGAADVSSRIIARGLGKELGQSVVIDNMPGAASTIASAFVARAPADGYTIVLGTNSSMIAEPTKPGSTVRYDVFKDFTPIGSGGQFTNYLVVRPGLPVNSVKELIAHGKANPGKLSYGTSNSTSELALARLFAGTGADPVNVRYRGDALALNDLLGGQIDILLTTGTATPGLAQQGKVKALMSLQSRRSPALPTVPTSTEEGLGEITIVPWVGFFGPAGMPADVTRTLSTALQKVLADPEVRTQLEEQGFQAYGMGPTEFAAFFKVRHTAWLDTIKKHNIKFD
ncbi:MAG: tripartite tricarboxylate transporter substrate binding protein [Comamonadaceae bacterium]|nr:MAG: tripartite tricarboxylate transporter substrate binding protein [Comamonadaceae bacterium]